MLKKMSNQILALDSSQAARFADDFVQESIDSLELWANSASESKQTMGVYSAARNQSQHKGGITYRFRMELNDSDAGRGETSNQLLARRMQ